MEASASDLIDLFTPPPLQAALGGFDMGLYAGQRFCRCCQVCSTKRDDVEGAGAQPTVDVLEAEVKANGYERVLTTRKVNGSAMLQSASEQMVPPTPEG